MVSLLDLLVAPLTKFASGVVCKGGHLFLVYPTDIEFPDYTEPVLEAVLCDHKLLTAFFRSRVNISIRYFDIILSCRYVRPGTRFSGRSSEPCEPREVQSLT